MATFRTTFVKNWATLGFNSGNTAHKLTSHNNNNYNNHNSKVFQGSKNQKPTETDCQAKSPTSSQVKVSNCTKC